MDDASREAGELDFRLREMAMYRRVIERHEAGEDVDAHTLKFVRRELRERADELRAEQEDREARGLSDVDLQAEFERYEAAGLI